MAQSSKRLNCLKIRASRIQNPVDSVLLWCTGKIRLPKKHFAITSRVHKKVMQLHTHPCSGLPGGKVCWPKHHDSRGIWDPVEQTTLGIC